jgi:hypothetical protein
LTINDLIKTHRSPLIPVNYLAGGRANKKPAYLLFDKGLKIIFQLAAAHTFTPLNKLPYLAPTCKTGDAGIGTIRIFFAGCVGCRASQGLVPPPLWIRATYSLFKKRAVIGLS